MTYDCLIIDDEEALSQSTLEYFELFGVKTAWAADAAACFEFFKSNTAGLILLDINLGTDSGFALCKKLREDYDLPILFISARTSDDDVLLALGIGGDDYIPKPYSLSVLLAKVKAVLKRYRNTEANSETSGFIFGKFYVDFDKGRVIEYATESVTDNSVKKDTGNSTDDDKRNVADNAADNITKNYNGSDINSITDNGINDVNKIGTDLKLKTMEYRLLVYLIQNRNRVVSKEEIFRDVWEDAITGDNTLNVHIRRLREKIEDNPNEPQYIQTVWGIGYSFEGGRK